LRIRLNSSSTRTGTRIRMFRRRLWGIVRPTVGDLTGYTPLLFFSNNSTGRQYVFFS